MAAAELALEEPDRLSTSSSRRLCIAASCLVQSNPIAGMLGCTAFAALAGYIAFFHTARLMVFNAVVALATSTVLAVREAQLR